MYARTGLAAIAIGQERSFLRGGSRLFQFDQTGKFVREIGQGTYSMKYAQNVRVDPQDNVWVVDAGTNTVTKFDYERSCSCWCSAERLKQSRCGPPRA